MHDLPVLVLAGSSFSQGDLHTAVDVLETRNGADRAEKDVSFRSEALVNCMEACLGAEESRFQEPLALETGKCRAI